MIHGLQEFTLSVTNAYIGLQCSENMALLSCSQGKINISKVCGFKTTQEGTREGMEYEM